jgi:hypothetical protein
MDARQKNLMALRKENTMLWTIFWFCGDWDY